MRCRCEYDSCDRRTGAAGTAAGRFCSPNSAATPGGSNVESRGASFTAVPGGPASAAARCRSRKIEVIPDSPRAGATLATGRRARGTEVIMKAP